MIGNTYEKKKKKFCTRCFSIIGFPLNKSIRLSLKGRHALFIPSTAVLLISVIYIVE